MSLIGNTRVTAAEHLEHDAVVLAKRVTEAPNTYQKQWDWTSGNLDYEGTADQGIATSDAKWLIYKYTWSGSNPSTRKTAVNIAWDDRAGGTYT